MAELTFKKIDDYRWEIPKTGAMRVPGLIYAAEHMLSKIQREKAMEQVANVATLPGIVGYSLAMPDIHWGYGFAVGGVAATNVSDGVISPGGIGFDISCLSGHTRVLHSLGYTRPIASLEHPEEDASGGTKNRSVSTLDTRCDLPVAADVRGFLKRFSAKPVYQITTRTGQVIQATSDHPFFTPDGMVAVERLRVGDLVAWCPFSGVPYTKPSDEIILTEDTIWRVLQRLNKGSRGNAAAQIMNQFRTRDLLPLRYSSPQLPWLLKLMGYHFGDGTMFFLHQEGKGIAWFFGAPSDLGKIQEDVARVGFTCSRIYHRARDHRISTHYDTICFSTTEYSCRVSSTAFIVLMAALGTPIGNKANQIYHIPPWIFRAPPWQQRLFLSGFLGAELSTPKAMSEHNFYCPVVSVSKRLPHLPNAVAFLEGVATLLQGFGVDTQAISRVHDDYHGVRGEVSGRVRLILSSRPESLVNLYTRVGFSYNQKRQYWGNVCAHYLQEKRLVVEQRNQIASEALALRQRHGWGAKRIQAVLQPTSVGLRFIERSIYEGRKTSPRIGCSGETFASFARRVTAGLGESGIVWEEIIGKEAIPWVGPVYDLTVDHPSHNFIANGFVVSNCGVRLLRTDLQKKTIEGKIPRLIDALFQQVPSGVGATGKVNLSKEEVKQVFKKGARWALEHGFGDPEDAEAIEDQGCLPQADPSVTSQRAVERGREQLGTLGSGNHFLEIQVVDQVFDEQVATAFGLFLDQIVVMVHTGSRGPGYQICEDFLRVMEQASRRYGFSLPDRQLACAPLSSQEGQDYFAAMCAGGNYARANRQVITHWVRETFMRTLEMSPKDLGMAVVYDVAHNVGKIEEHEFQGKRVKVCVHRKGATRAFPAGHPDLPEKYRAVGQPVLVPGSMGTYSYVLVGTERAMRETFGTTCHGAGRMMSRSQALKQVHGRDLQKQLEEQGILVRTDSYKGLAEEAPFAYKDVSEVVEVCHQAGISKKVARVRPLGVVKG
ncbi:MAG: RtcB family protein [Elusimicrobia bacterium]|nr:RtcB family protein [Elusimicrobiota bacterium]